MVKIFIVLVIVLIFLLIIFLYRNRNIIIKVLKCNAAMFYLNHHNSKEDHINYDDLIEKKEDIDYNIKPTVLSTILDFLNEHPEIKESIKKEKMKEAEEDNKYSYPIKRSQAKEIANSSATLKSDFCANSQRNGISYLGFSTYSINIIEKDSKKYWQYEVLSGDISWIEHSKYGETYCDGCFSENDLELLRCLIDVETGDYIYYPKVDKYRNRTVKYEDRNTIKIDRSTLPSWLSSNDFSESNDNNELSIPEWILKDDFDEDNINE